MSYNIQIIRDPSAMQETFALVKLLTPDITPESYQNMLYEMVQSGYFQILVRDEENKLIAVSGIWIATKIYSGKYLEMDNVVVDEHYRSAGIGKLLVDFVEDLAKKENCQTIMLDAYLENTKAHEFYLRKGFIKRGFHFIKKL